MATSSYQDKLNSTINHIRSHLRHLATAEQIENRVKLIENNMGDPSACARGMAHDELAKAMLFWFERKDLDAVRQHFYLQAKLQQFFYQRDISDERTNLTNSPGPKNFQLLAPLVSNNLELIKWYMQCDDIYDMERVEKEKTDDFLMYQSIVALRGEWDRLLERCDRVIGNPPVSLKKWHDYHFLYQAIAEKNMEKIESILADMVTGKKVRTRISEEYPFTEHLIFSRIIIVMKIAWMHGMEVSVGSPYVPMEWMQTTPLEKYDNHFSFLK
jgi:hypothetical protein